MVKSFTIRLLYVILIFIKTQRGEIMKKVTKIKVLFTTASIIYVLLSLPVYILMITAARTDDFFGSR